MPAYGLKGLTATARGQGKLAFFANGLTSASLVGHNPVAVVKIALKFGQAVDIFPLGQLGQIDDRLDDFNIRFESSPGIYMRFDGITIPGHFFDTGRREDLQGCRSVQVAHQVQCRMLELG